MKEIIMKKGKNTRFPSIFEAIIPILTMVGLMIYVFVFEKDGKENIYDAAHLPIICGIIVASLVGLICGRSFRDMLDGMIERIRTTLDAILILLTVGLLIF